MALFEIKVPLGIAERICRAVEDIRDDFRMYCFPERKTLPSKPRGPECLIEFDPEAAEAVEAEEERKKYL